MAGLLADPILAGIGVTFMGLSTIPLMEGLIPPPPAERTTNIRLVIGSNDNADGNEPRIHLFDNQGLTIGFHEGTYDAKIGRGVGHDISVVQTSASSASAQAEYMSIIQDGNDAICISAIIVTTPDGIRYTFYGDIAVSCGAPWYYGNTTVSIQDGIYQPNCMWLDGDGSANIQAKAYGIHLPSFLANTDRAEQYNSNYDLMCKPDPRFHIYNDLKLQTSIPYFKKKPFDDATLLDFDGGRMAFDRNNWDTRPVDKAVFENPNHGLTSMIGRSEELSSATGPRSAGRLIVSTQSRHSATELCESGTSKGPDFVSLAERIFCDMDQKKTYPLCESTTQNNCFDLKARAMRFDKRSARRDENGHILPRKVYKEVQSW